MYAVLSGAPCAIRVLGGPLALSPKGVKARRDTYNKCRARLRAASAFHVRQGPAEAASSRVCVSRLECRSWEAGRRRTGNAI
jgi:hypothetical protein